MSERRQLLRQRTAAIHQQLDDQVGNFTSLDEYVAYLKGMIAFRADVEKDISRSPIPTEFADYRPNLILAELHRDLAATGGQDRNTPSTEPSIAEKPLSRDALLGLLYVLEGSSLGARILAKRAERLGLHEETGAAHLKKQSASLGNWNAFCALLETADKVDEDAMVESAMETFARALRAFEKV